MMPMRVVRVPVPPKTTHKPGRRYLACLCGLFTRKYRCKKTKAGAELSPRPSATTLRTPTDQKVFGGRPASRVFAPREVQTGQANVTATHWVSSDPEVVLTGTATASTEIELVNGLGPVNEDREVGI